jgi:hypothetical protein
MAYSSLSGGGSPPLRKMSRSMVIVAACLLGVVVGLLGLNYWHTSKCISSKTPDEMEIYIEGIAKRLLQAESQVHLSLHQILSAQFDKSTNSD